ncbi:hypothetical protein IV102_12310 [bacterium]|nr:hypothetical protein [bacterium]
MHHELAARWGVQLQGPLPGARYGKLHACLDRQCRSLFLKVLEPGLEAQREILAMRMLTGPRVELLQWTEIAYLMERIVPGTTLRSLPDEQAAVQLAACAAALGGPREGFPAVSDWLAALQVHEWADRARQRSVRLLASAPSPRLLHGDLHHDNILLCAQTGWLAIDAKGVVGELAFELAASLYNPWPGLLEMDDPQSTTSRRLELMAPDREGRRRLADWGFVRATLAACWEAEEGKSPGHALACAQLLEPFLED